MRVFLLLTCFLAISFQSIAQTIRVVDKQQQAVEQVIVVGERYSSQTDSDGFVQHSLTEDCLMLVFIHPNFKRFMISRDQLEAQHFIVTLEQKMHMLDEVTIHPHKRDLLLNESPQKINTLTPATVQIYQPQTTADLLGTSSEVYIQKSQMGGGSPMLRGFSANRILLVLDGVRMNNAIYRSGNLHNVIALDASVMEQTEVILGPGSVIYGSDALGGVIHFYTLKPRLSTSAPKTSYHALIRTSSANFEKTGHLHIQRSAKQWAAVTSLTFSDFDDLLMGNRKHEDYIRSHYVETNGDRDQMVLNPNPNRQIQTAYSQLNLLHKIRYRPSNQADIEYAFHFTRSSDVPRYDRLIQYSGEQLKYAEWYYGPQQWMMHSLKATLNPGAALANHVSILAAFQDYTESRHDRRFGKAERYSRTENVDAFSLNIDLDKNFSKTRWLYYGIEGVYNVVHSRGALTDLKTELVQALASRYPDNARWWSLAAYSMYQHLLKSGNSLQAGLRYNLTGMNGKFDPADYALPFDEFQDTNGALSANLGIVVNTGEQGSITLNGSTGFRAPNIDDAAKVFDSEPGSVMVPNPKLEPEFAYTFEIGNHWGTNNFLYDLNLFYTRLANAMVRRDGQLNGKDSILYEGQMSKVRMIANASWANLAGVSMVYHWKLYKNLNFKGGINWQTGNDSDGMPMRHVAPLFGNTHLMYHSPRLTLDGYLLFNGRIAHHQLAAEELEKPEMYAKDINGKPFSPAWMTLNIKGSYKVNKTLMLNAGIENLLNVRYRPYSSGIAAPGLNFVGSVIMNL